MILWASSAVVILYQFGKIRNGPKVPENMVELVGLEPTTSSLRTMRSPN